MIDRVRKIIDFLDISVREFEVKIGASSGVISRAVRNNTDIQSKWITSIADNYPQFSMEWLITGRGEMLKPNETLPGKVEEVALHDGYRPAREVIAEQSVPMFDMQMALSDTQIAPKGFVYIPDLPRCDGAIRMYGDHMTPVLKGGDIIVYRKVKDLSNEFFWGSMYMLSLSLDGDEQILVRYVHRCDESDSIRLTSENTTYPPKTIPLNSIKALAEIKASIRYHIAM